MDPIKLLGPDSALGMPAPVWFVLFFKVLGFTLHLVPMNLWYAGVFLVGVLSLWGGDNAKLFAQRLIKQMPIAVALGVNFGIVPLLFTQVVFYKLFYPATILIAWFWFSVIPLLMVAYYGVYVYAIQVRHQHLTRLGVVAGWTSAVCFTVIGFIFVNSFSLMVNVEQWQTLWQSANVDGASLGLMLNVFDATLLPRWLMMLGLALTTVAAYSIVDAAFFAAKEKPAYQRWVASFALKLCTLGIVWFAVAGTLYLFATMRADTRAFLLSMPLLALTGVTALVPGITWVLIFVQRTQITRARAVATATAQFGVLALNAISRQIVQSVELGRWLNVDAEPVLLQPSPLIVFLLLFGAGVGVIAWMIAQIVRASRAPSRP